MKKVLVVLILVVLSGSQSVFAGNDPYKGKVKSGEYFCQKDGQTCYFTKQGLASGAKGPGCPQMNIKNMDKPEVMAKYYNEMAVFLNSDYCKFKPTTVKKYICDYKPGHAEIFVNNKKVISVGGDIDKYPMKQYFYQPSKCTQVPLD